MIVAWTPEAERDRADVFDHIAAENPAAAVRMDLTSGAAASRLEDHPLIGKPGRIAGTREFIPHPSYRLVYAVGPQSVWVLALVHTARLWP